MSTASAAQGNAIASPEALVLRHSYNCSVETLFDAWLDPDTVRQFMAPGTHQVTQLKWDGRAGGEFFVEMTGDGKQHPHNGRFIEVTRPRRIVFTWTSPHAGKDTLVTLDFAAAGERALLTLTHERLPQEQHQGHTWGWTGIMDKLEAKLAAA
jgi:uncharacterized protein YndB with AHSA1/START domain